MTRASDVQKAERLNLARSLLQQHEHVPDAVAQLARACSISPRQACRYLELAQQLKAPVPVGDAKIAFTVKLLPQIGAAPPDVCQDDRSDLERDRQLGAGRGLEPRGRAWLTGRRFSGPSFWSIDLIACWRRSWFKPTNCSSPTNAVPQPANPEAGRRW